MVSGCKSDLLRVTGHCPAASNCEPLGTLAWFMVVCLCFLFLPGPSWVLGSPVQGLWLYFALHPFITRGVLLNSHLAQWPWSLSFPTDPLPCLTWIPAASVISCWKPSKSESSHLYVLLPLFWTAGILIMFPSTAMYFQCIKDINAMWIFWGRGGTVDNLQKHSGQKWNITIFKILEFF